LCVKQESDKDCVLVASSVEVISSARNFLMDHNTTKIVTMEVMDHLITITQ